mgnify:CR=1 FL=1
MPSEYLSTAFVKIIMQSQLHDGEEYNDGRHGTEYVTPFRRAIAILKLREAGASLFPRSFFVIPAQAGIQFLSHSINRLMLRFPPARE